MQYVPVPSQAPDLMSQFRGQLMDSLDRQRQRDLQAALAAANQQNDWKIAQAQMAAGTAGRQQEHGYRIEEMLASQPFAEKMAEFQVQAQAEQARLTREQGATEFGQTHELGHAQLAATKEATAAGQALEARRETRLTEAQQAEEKFQARSITLQEKTLDAHTKAADRAEDRLDKEQDLEKKKALAGLLGNNVDAAEGRAGTLWEARHKRIDADETMGRLTHDGAAKARMENDQWYESTMVRLDGQRDKAVEALTSGAPSGAPAGPPGTPVGPDQKVQQQAYLSSYTSQMAGLMDKAELYSGSVPGATAVAQDILELFYKFTGDPAGPKLPYKSNSYLSIVDIKTAFERKTGLRWEAILGQPGAQSQLRYIGRELAKPWTALGRVYRGIGAPVRAVGRAWERGNIPGPE